MNMEMFDVVPRNLAEYEKKYGSDLGWQPPGSRLSRMEQANQRLQFLQQVVERELADGGESIFQHEARDLKAALRL